jgi:hypothetical protein
VLIFNSLHLISANISKNEALEEQDIFSALNPYGNIGFQSDNLLGIQLKNPLVGGFQF